MGTACRHCGRRTGFPNRRGLCRSCHADPAAKALYPRRWAGLAWGVPWHEPTEAELEALIEQQMRCLPDWWEEETERMRKRGE